jgi:hypothetical protein
MHVCPRSIFFGNWLYITPARRGTNHLVVVTRPPRFLRAEPGSSVCCIEPARRERQQHFIDEDDEEPASDHPTYRVTYQIAW